MAKKSKIKKDSKLDKEREEIEVYKTLLYWSSFTIIGCVLIILVILFLI